MSKWFLLPLVLILDCITKIWAIEHVPTISSAMYPFGGIPIFSWAGVTFSLNYATNTGAAWGMLAGYAGLLFVVRSLIIIWLVIFMKKNFPVWLIIAGAIGNMVDYCLYGHVIDFFHCTFWGYSFPIFNVADACISIGIVCLLLVSWKKKAAVST